MFQDNNSKPKQLIKEVVKMKNILICMVFVVVAFCATSAWAITASVSAPAITVNATVPTVTGGLSVSLSQITGEDPVTHLGGVWTAATSMSFGTLVWHPENGTNGKPLNIFLPTSYYAVDIGVSDNTGTDWRVTQARASMVRSAGGNIDDKVNVTFSKQTSATVSAWQDKFTFGESAGKVYTKAQLAGGWLRIYYGIATGEAGRDAANATPIGLDTPAGTYQGSVTITLSP
jgi:hypothetical protein